MASTQPRKAKAGWLSLGWLTDPELVKQIKSYREAFYPPGTPLSKVVRDVLSVGMDRLLRECKERR